MDNEKIAKIQNAPFPTNTTELRWFLWLAGYNRSFNNNFAETSAVLHNATSGNKKLRWTGEMWDALQGLKKKMTTWPVLSFPNIEQNFIVETDASSVSLGEVFSKEKEDGKIPLQFASRTMTSAERNYSAYEREPLAVIFPLKNFRVCLLSLVPCKVITYHMALRYAFQKHDLHGRLEGCIEVLAEYDSE